MLGLKSKKAQHLLLPYTFPLPCNTQIQQGYFRISAIAEIYYYNLLPIGAAISRKYQRDPFKAIWSTFHLCIFLSYTCKERLTPGIRNNESCSKIVRVEMVILAPLPAILLIDAPHIFSPVVIIWIQHHQSSSAPEAFVIYLFRGSAVWFEKLPSLNGL